MVNKKSGQSICFTTKRRYGKTFLMELFKKHFMEHNKINVDPVQLEAEKAYKESKDQFKKEIAVMVKEQKIMKKQANAKGGEQSSASQSSAAFNKIDLRHYYIAYAEFRRKYGGYTKYPEKTLDENKVNMKYVNEIIQKYVPKTVYTD